MNEKGHEIAIIIVTHNSELYLPQCIASLQKQTFPSSRIILVDSGSASQDYLKCYESYPNISLCLLQENVGFCEGNNRGISQLSPETNYVLFLNPDAFLTPSFLEEAVRCMELDENASVGALTGLLLGYDIQKGQPTGYIDSAGIFRLWYGRWYDRGQGEPEHTRVFSCGDVPAICGALMFCRKEALDQVVLGLHQVMDPSFYMYKEDIDLSLRLRRQGWRLLFLPHLIAYHCRGWKKNRSQVPKDFRLLSARNEMRLYARLFSPCWFYSALKYASVKLFNF